MERQERGRRVRTAEWLILLFIGTLLLTVLTGPSCEAHRREDDMAIRAPEFPAGMEWLNTGHPLSWHELRGKIVLLDFWTYCCINCMHIIPDLKRLEDEFPDELVVIGVHSAKFTAEHDTDNIRRPSCVMRSGTRWSMTGT